ncbi:unnamed protein product [Ciceribacter sp. T2.26MG-112.2]|uniref:2Fe-2S iron-sulfur cluster-binding protein n=1 Tax=Ciceribacter sp. T2.26MG-112.2 TaxID=3137154 RepID=UPI000E15BAD1|nr:2Fe-2S iron-sulfur cluster-binding protein [Ciceribacter naphthalenivorans]SSC69949.1 unnamed protein product [Ciceribacter naphthalenivorans]SSX47436.1 unnamed protein product [Ciceribacter naphthalenivorans]
MTQITFVAANGESHQIEATDGLNLMECARRANIPGIIAECGGACACATCHVYVDDEWAALVGIANAMERDMLEFADAVRDNSRLSCQIKVTDQLDGLTVYLPAS